MSSRRLNWDVKSPVKSFRPVTQSHLANTDRSSVAALIVTVILFSHLVINLSMEDWCHPILVQHIYGEMW